MQSTITHVLGTFDQFHQGLPMEDFSTWYTTIPDPNLEDILFDFLWAEDDVFSLKRLTSGGIIGARDGRRQFLSANDLHAVNEWIEGWEDEDQSTIDDGEYLDEHGEVVDPPRDDVEE